MTYGLPAHGEANWDTKLVASVDAVKTTADSATTAAATAQSDINAHKANVANPHAVTKSQVGLGNVDNTSDVNKPVSTAQLAAFTKNNNTGTNASTARAPHTTTFNMPASTSGTDDFAVHTFRATAQGDFTGVTATNPGWFFGTNFYTTVGAAAGDGTGLTQVLNLAETTLTGTSFTGTAIGLQAEAAFLGASAGGTASTLISMKVAVPKRKDGATAGNATNVYGLYIDSVPSGTLGSSTAYALFVAGGASYLSGDLTVAGNLGIPAASTFYLGSRQLKDDGTNVTINSTTIAPAFGYSTDSSRKIVWCTGTPEGAVTANVGSLALRLDGGASTTLYVKQSGTGNTGWVAK